MKKFITHATCYDSLELQEQETYLIMGRPSDLWRVKSEYVGASCALGTQPGPPPLLQPSLWCQNLYCICQRSLGFESHTEWRCREHQSRRDVVEGDVDSVFQRGLVKSQRKGSLFPSPDEWTRGLGTQDGPVEWTL